MSDEIKEEQPIEETTPVETPEPVKSEGDLAKEAMELRIEKVRAARDKIQSIDWDQIQTVDELKAVVKSIYELVT